MTNDSRDLVEAGYNAVADEYLKRFAVSSVRQRWIDRFVSGLPNTGGRVLDLGCGAGIPVARDLVALGHAVVGVDGSKQQILRARQNVADATFIQADMCEVAFGAASFDRVGAFYSLTHLPALQQASLIAQVANWLKPDGIFVASFASDGAGEWVGEWLGVTMFFGHSTQAETFRSLKTAGLQVTRSRVERQDNEETAFMWIRQQRAVPGFRNLDRSGPWIVRSAVSPKPPSAVFRTVTAP